MYAGAFNRGGHCWRRVEGAYRNLVFTVYKRRSVSADPKVRSRLVPSKCFSPCLLCCVCWPRNWDLLRSLWFSRSVSCLKRQRKKEKGHTGIQPESSHFISQVTKSSSSSELTKCPDNISPTIVCLRTAGDHDDLSLEVEVQTLQPWWATCFGQLEK